MQNRTTTEEKHPAHHLPNQRFLEVYQLSAPGISDAGKIKQPLNDLHGRFWMFFRDKEDVSGETIFAAAVAAMFGEAFNTAGFDVGSDFIEYAFLSTGSFWAR